MFGGTTRHAAGGHCGRRSHSIPAEHEFGDRERIPKSCTWRTRIPPDGVWQNGLRDMAKQAWRCTRERESEVSRTIVTMDHLWADMRRESRRAGLGKFRGRRLGPFSCIATKREREMSLQHLWYRGKQRDGRAEEQRVVSVTLNNDHDRNTIHYHSSGRQTASTVVVRAGRR